ncbi:hypothetical protein SLH49_16730 [Cognatiyoonia sp. IB215446]|uniref:hypothetical protein n=1 Tax=Cognatiyoonia sp. IB215446 TaxID=3097355 RepID=UPI002A0C115B|nr:hypothetical protein [Cognatiyoonia sp. IB215446]MDX8349632.1 hypothetical protein [Cognatiyoonia sp. IB215446]
MPKYHPIDVRYKGPSTAYTGSAKKKLKSKPRPVSDITTPKKSPAPVQRAASSRPTNPWGGNNTSELEAFVRKTVDAKPRKPQQMPLAMRLLVPWPFQLVLDLFRRLGWAWSIALIYLLGTVLF